MRDVAGHVGIGAYKVSDDLAKIIDAVCVGRVAATLVLGLKRIAIVEVLGRTVGLQRVKAVIRRILRIVDILVRSVPADDFALIIDTLVFSRSVEPLVP